MSKFPDWEKYAVHQRRPWTGCIPTAFEMLLRAARAEGIDFATFQDEFDLDQHKKPGESPSNNFGSLHAMVQKKYPQVEFDQKSPSNGTEKVTFIQEQLAAGKLVMASIWMGEFGNPNWHIMPVVDMDENSFTLLREKRADGSLDTWRVMKSDVARIHDQYDGGKEVAYLVKC